MATVYYLIRERRLGNKEDDDSPYGFVSLSIMDEIEEITEEAGATDISNLGFLD